LYNELIRGFTAPLPGGLKELALLMGNMAHESGAFNYVEEIRCAGVNFVTGECPYGLYHGRGHIQLSWDYNYREAANYLNNQRILTDPNIVMNDPMVIGKQFNGSGFLEFKIHSDVVATLWEQVYAPSTVDSNATVDQFPHKESNSSNVSKETMDSQ